MAADDTAAAQEDVTLLASGNVLANDTDANAGDSKTVTTVAGSAANVGVALAGIYGTLTINADGSYDYALNNSDPAVQALAGGSQVAETFSYAMADSQGATSSANLVVTITGTNDTPQVAAALSASAAEDDAVFTVELLAGASDVDDGETPTLSVQNVTGLVAGLTFSGTTLTVDPADAAFQHLAVGDSQAITVTYDVVDIHGAATPQTATVTVTGSNDAPQVAAALSASAAEDDAVFTLDLLAGASDVDNGETPTLNVQNLTGLVAGVTLSGTTLTVDPSDAAFQQLAAGEQQVITVNFDVVDSHGAITPQTAIITITGTNDAPAITSAAQSGSVAEAANNSADEINNVTHEATGALAFGDVDLSDGHSVAVTGNATPGYRGTLSASIADPSTGDGAGSIGWTFAVADGALDDLAATDVLTQTYTVTVDDGHGSMSSQTVTITINGAADNQAPVVTGEVTLAAIAEDSGARLITQAELLANTTDPDGPNLTATDLQITAGNGALVDNGNGTWSYTPALNDDTDVSFSYQVTDGIAPPVATSATLDITPVNDAPVATDDTLSSVSDDSGVRIISFASLLGNDSKGPANESGQTLTITALSNVVGGTAVINGTNIEFTPAANFNGTASFDYTVQDNGQTNGADDFKTDTGSVSFAVTAVND